MNSYYIIEVNHLQADREDLVVALAFDFDCSGVSENLLFKQENDNYQPETLSSEFKNLVLYFEKQPNEELLLKLPQITGDADIKMLANENKDWLSEWKKGFAAFCLADPFWIVPSWLEPPEEAKQVIRIDPGMAFGTGTHETTSLVAHLLVESDSAPAISVLDVGTGTAILAMLVKKMGAHRVVGIDVDVEARRVARENLAFNNLENEIDILDSPLDKIEGQFDWVMANIIDGILLRLKNSIIDKTLPGGKIFLSGVLRERKEEFLLNFLNGTSLELLREVSKGEWLAFELRKN